MNAISLSLADIDVRVQIFSETLPKCGVFAAHKALARIAQAENADLSAVSATVALDRFEALRDSTARSSFYDQRLYLRQALNLPEIPADVAGRIHRGKPTVADAIAMVDLQEAWGSERGRVIGALRRFAAKLKKEHKPKLATDEQLASLPAVLGFVDRTFEQFGPGDFGVAKNSYATFQSRIRRAARLVDVHARRRLSQSMISGGWQALLDLIGYGDKASPKGIGGNAAKIWPLLDFCYRHDIAPCDVDDATINDLITDLERRGRENPFEIAQNAVDGWQYFQEGFPLFPQRKIERLYREGYGQPYEIPFKDLPEAFRKDWEVFKATFGKAAASLADLVPDAPIDDLARAHAPKSIGTPFSQEQLANLRTAITYAANHLMTKGVEPQRIADVLSPAVLDEVIRMIRANQKLRAQDGGPAYTDKHNYTRNTASLFIAAAKRLRLGKDAIKEMTQTLDAVDPRVLSVSENEDGKLRRQTKQSLIGPRHKARLKQFNDPVKLLSWYDVFTTLWKLCQAVIASERTPDPEEINDAICAVLHAILRCCPLRRENLAALRLDDVGACLSLPTSGKGCGYIFIPGEMTKNGEDIQVELTPEAVTVIDLYLRHFRPALAQNVGAHAENPFLFPMRGMKHRSGVLLNKHFVKRNKKLGGFILNLHCQRHLSAKIILDQDVNKMALVQQLLGHKKIETTQAYYAEINMIFAQREFHLLLERKRENLLKQLGVKGR